MTVMRIIHLVIAAVTIGFGLLSVLAPQAALRFTGLAAPSPRGISEVRAVLGGVFVGLGIAALLYQTQAAFGTIGIVYLAIAVVRVASIFVDRASTGSNWWSLAFEVVCGVLLLIR